MIASALKSLFTPSPVKQQAHAAYLAIVAQSRKPVFYADWQVEDSIDGRFDIIVLHMFLVLSALEEKLPPPSVGEGKGGGDGATNSSSSMTHLPPPPTPSHKGRGNIFHRMLSEIFFADMDRSLREMGVGDTGVGHRVKKMAQAFYGRLKAYADDASLEESLRRNVWREKPVTNEAVAALAAYMRRNYDALRTQPTEALMRGDITFSS